MLYIPRIDPASEYGSKYCSTAIMFNTGHDALQLLVDEMYPLVCWAVKGSKLVVKVTRPPSCVDKSCYHHETEHGTVGTGYLHVGQHFYLCTMVSAASSCIGFSSVTTTLKH